MSSSHDDTILIWDFLEPHDSRPVNGAHVDQEHGVGAGDNPVAGPVQIADNAQGGNPGDDISDNGTFFFF